MSARDAFTLEAMADFPDDALLAQLPLTPQHIDAMMANLRRCGVRRVSWGYYGDGHGGLFTPTFGYDNPPADGSMNKWANYAETLRLLDNPLRVAAEAAHRHGLELYAYYKPYETGPGIVLPEGSSEARIYGRLPHLGGRLSWLDRFVMDHPNLRIQRRTDDLPADVSSIPIHALKLIKKDASPTRVSRERLKIWASSLNYRYERLPIQFDLHETVETAKRDVRDVLPHIDGELTTRQGDPVRVLTLSGFRLTEPYLLVTTDFTEGPADFENAGTELLVALDEQGREIPGCCATGSTVWMAEQVNFRDWGLMFDYGWGRHRVRLDEPNASGNQGLIAFTRGRNGYLPGALCETEPEVQTYWLSCIREMLDAGVDGVDFREENHSTHTDYPEDYGFNPAVLAECARQGSTDQATVSRVRGDAYTAFLRQAKALISAAGKRMRINLQIDLLHGLPDHRRLAYPANLHFDWRRWIAEGLLDEGILRFYSAPFTCIFEDEVALEVTARCRERGIPICVNRYINSAALHEEAGRVCRDGRFSGFILYETYDFVRFAPDGGCSISMEAVETLAEKLFH